MVLPSRSIGFMLCALLLAACGTSVTSLQQGAQQVTQSSRENFDALKKDVQDMVTFKPEKPPRTVPPSYCYQVMQDIMCYREAMDGARDRLVGFQGTVADEPKEEKQASVATPVQAAAAPVAPVEAVSAVTPQVPQPLTQAPQPLTQSGDQTAKAEQSMAHFDALKPVTVGAGPAVKADTSTPATQ